ncbi:transposase [Trichonephila clavipes]|nr:transposase [Trichonephila clavipes]
MQASLRSLAEDQQFLVDCSQNTHGNPGGVGYGPIMLKPHVVEISLLQSILTVFETQATIKNVKSEPRRKFANSKIHCTETRIIFRRYKDCNKRSIFYNSIDGNDHTKWLRQLREKFPNGFMIVEGFSNNGKLKIKKVSNKSKINSLYYQQNISEPIFVEEIPVLYGNDIYEVELHMDKAFSHTSKSKTAYLAKIDAETGIKCIKFDEIPVKLSKSSPMDLCTVGLVKLASGKWHSRTLNEL